MPFRSLVAFALVVSCSSAARSDAARDDSLEGTWLPSAANSAKKFPDEVRKTIRLEVKGDNYTVTVGTQPDRGICKLDPSAKPKALDITGTEGPNKGRTIPAIYEREATRCGSVTTSAARAAPRNSRPRRGPDCSWSSTS